MRMIIATALIALILGLLALGLVYISKDAAKVHEALDGFMKEAAQASDRKELLNLRSRLIVYIHQHVWHRHLAVRARAIVSYIDGRLAGPVNKH